MSRTTEQLPPYLNTIFIFAFLFPLLFITGCTREVSWIKVEPPSLELNKAGETFELEVIPLDKENEPVPDAQLSFTSSNPDVATVDETGTITAQGTGHTVITVMSANGEKAVVQCKVSILGEIKIIPENLVLEVGEEKQLESKVLNEKGELFEDQNVSWATSDEEIVFIDDLGYITAVKPGTVTITGTIPGKGLSHAYGVATVTVVPAEESEQPQEEAPEAEEQQ